MSYRPILFRENYPLSAPLKEKGCVMRLIFKHSTGIALVMAASLAFPSASMAQTVPDEGGLSPALAAIKRTHTVRLGYRESSLPFSFLDQASRPIGYSLELCEAVVERMGTEVDDVNLKIEYVKVTSDNRIKAILDNQIDLECGSTTANAERARLVAFSPLIFVAGTKLMVARSSPINEPQDLRGKTVAVTKGTTNEEAIRAIDAKYSLGLTIVRGEDHEQSYQLLATQKADAFATDDILLYGLIARHKSQDKFRVAGDYLSYEPYGIMFRKDEPQLKSIVEQTFRALATDHDLIPLYRKWFVARLPTGERLGVPISPQLEQGFNVLDASGSNSN
jgi:glutamate/aspartate transport system substrate-binding protein